MIVPATPSCDPTTAVVTAASAPAKSFGSEMSSLAASFAGVWSGASSSGLV